MKNSDIQDSKKYKSTKFQEPDKVKSRHFDHVSVVTDLSTGKEYIYKDTKGSQNLKFTEVIGQEIFRLVMPHHPEYRFVLDDNKEIIGVISEKVSGKQLKEQSYKNKDSKVLEPGSLEKICDRKYTMAGGIHVCSIFTGEVDLRMTNLFATDKKLFSKEDRKLVKIDGDWMFAHLDKDSAFKAVIPKGALEDLPFLNSNSPDDSKKLCVWNWFGQVRFGVDHHLDENHQKYVAKLQGLQNNPQYRDEVNESVLKILLMDDVTLKGFLSLYLDDVRNGDEIKHILFLDLSATRQQLYKDAMQNESLIEYMKTNKSKNVAESFKKTLEEFQNNNKKLLTQDSDITAMQDRVDQTFNTILQKSKEAKIIVEKNDEPPPSNIDDFDSKHDDFDEPELGVNRFMANEKNHEQRVNLVSKSSMFIPSKGITDHAKDKEMISDPELQDMLSSVRKSERFLEDPVQQDLQKKPSPPTPPLKNR